MSGARFYEKLSRELSLVLRHMPEKYNLVLDDGGWVSLEQLLAALHQIDKWRFVTIQDIENMMKQATKQRHEIKDGRIRAYYGHSFKEKIRKEIAIPPRYLYHGTTPEAAEQIVQQGLKPMSRQYVHLSTNIKTARLVAERRTATPVLFRIDTQQVKEPFYFGNEDIWLVDAIMPENLEIML